MATDVDDVDDDADDAADDDVDLFLEIQSHRQRLSWNEQPLRRHTFHTTCYQHYL